MTATNQILAKLMYQRLKVFQFHLCYEIEIEKDPDFPQLNLKCSYNQQSSILYIDVSRWMDCYPTAIGKDFLLWLLTVIFNEAKVLPLKLGLHHLGV